MSVKDKLLFNSTNHKYFVHTFTAWQDDEVGPCCEAR